MHETFDVLLFILLYVGYVVFGTFAIPWKMVREYDPNDMNVNFKKFLIKFTTICTIRMIIICIICTIWTYLISLLF